MAFAVSTRRANIVRSKRMGSRKAPHSLPFPSPTLVVGGPRQIVAPSSDLRNRSDAKLDDDRAGAESVPIPVFVPSPVKHGLAIRLRHVEERVPRGEVGVQARTPRRVRRRFRRFRRFRRRVSRRDRTNGARTRPQKKPWKWNGCS